MSVYIALIIMLVAGTCGGLVNALIRREFEEDEKNKITLGSRAVIGIGASFLVPLVLEIANSNLLADPHCSWDVGNVIIGQ